MQGFPRTIGMSQQSSKLHCLSSFFLRSRSNLHLVPFAPCGRRLSTYRVRGCAFSSNENHHRDAYGHGVWKSFINLGLPPESAWGLGLKRNFDYIPQSKYTLSWHETRECDQHIVIVLSSDGYRLLGTQERVQHQNISLTLTPRQRCHGGRPRTLVNNMYKISRGLVQPHGPNSDENDNKLYPRNPFMDLSTVVLTMRNVQFLPHNRRAPAYNLSSRHWKHYNKIHRALLGVELSPQEDRHSHR